MKGTEFSAIERSIIAKIGSARFPPATASKRFARDLSSGAVTQLTGKGRRFLAYVANRFRRQYLLSADEIEWISQWINWKEDASPETSVKVKAEVAKVTSPEQLEIVEVYGTVEIR